MNFTITKKTVYLRRNNINACACGNRRRLRQRARERY